jgi:Xaa-Pro aminopeptidase
LKDTQLPQLVNLQRAREIMARERIDGLIARVPLNVYYLSGYWGLLMSAERFDASFFAVLPASDRQPAALVLPSMELRRLVAQGGSWIPETFIFTRPDDEQDQIALDGAPYAGWPIRQDAELTRLEKRGIAATRAQAGRVSGNARGALARAVRAAGLERASVVTDDVRVGGWLESAGLAEVRCREDANVFNRIRLVKTDAELTLMRKAASVNEAAARQAAAAFRDGAEWQDIESVYAAAIAAAGGRASYLMCGAGGPRNGRLQRGEPMFIDALGTYAHYHGDFGRCVVIGEADRQTRQRHAALDAGWQAAADVLRPGIRYSEIAETVVAAVRAAGLPEFVYATPHALGLEHTDDPKTVGGQQGGTTDTRLEEGMVLNIDMPFTEIGWGSVHIEDTVRITADGFEVLTSDDREIIEVSP